MLLPEPLQVTVRVARALERLGLRYLVGGSLASSLHGLPRNTNDADVVVELPGRSVAELVADLEHEFYADADMIHDAIRRGASFNLIHLATMFKVDIFVLRREPLMLEEMNRRQLHEVVVDSGERVWFASPEDTILQKLDWFKKGNEISDRQWQDVLGILKVRGDTLDLAYLRTWAPSLGVTELLERALSQGRTQTS